MKNTYTRILLFFFTFAVAFFYFSNSVWASSLNLGSFTPVPTQEPTPTVTPEGGASTLASPTPTPTGEQPPTTPNIECQAPPPTELEASIGRRPYSGNKGIAFGEIYMKMTGHGMNQQTTIAQFDQVEQHLQEYRIYSTAIFGNSAYYYTKGFLRFGFKQGFGLADKAELYQTFLPLSCGERLQVVAPHLPTPISFFTDKDQTIRLILGSYIVDAFIKPDGKIYTGGNIYDSISYTIAQVQFAKPTTGWVASSDRLLETLAGITGRLGFTASQKREFLVYWQRSLPSANYYLIQYLPQEEAKKLAPWRVLPTPDREYRHFFVFTPLISLPVVMPTQPELPSVNLSGFTVVDWGGVISY